MKYKVILTPEASEQAEKAYRWIEKSSPENAARWHVRMARYLRSIDPYQHVIHTNFGNNKNRMPGPYETVFKTEFLR